MRSSSNIKVNLSINGVPVAAIIDTAAQVTIISDGLYKSLKVKPPTLSKVILHTAGRDLKMSGYKVGPVSIVIGSQTFPGNEVYVAPVEDDMLLGLDFLYQHGAIINMSNGKLEIGHGRFRMSCSIDSCSNLQVAEVKVSNNAIVPPCSVLRLPCSAVMSCDYVIEPIEFNSILSPRSLHTGGSTPVLCLINLTNKQVKLKQGQVVGFAHSIHEVLPDSDPETVKIQKVESTTDSSDVEIPDHLKDLLARSSEHLSSEERDLLQAVLHSYSDVFATNEFDLGNFTTIEHSIDTGDSRPIKQRLRRTPVCYVDEEEKHLNKLLGAGVIEPSTSEWASAPVLVRKKDGTLRWCIDYRALNAVTKKDVFPLPLVDECLDTLTGNLWFSKLDANWAYLQIKVKNSDKEKTAFITKYGTFQFNRMGFGLCNAPSTYSRVMNLVLRGLHWKTVLAFLDDILVLGKDFKEHLNNITDVFKRFRSFGLKLKPKKCVLFKQEVEFLGRTVNRSGLGIGQSYIDTMNNWPIPLCTKDVERFCGFANYHRNFIKDFAEMIAPLYAVTGKNRFNWGDEQQSAFDKVKLALTSAPVLTLPTKEGHFILDTDASEYALGAELLQIQDGQERTISYASIGLLPEQKRYCTTRKELLAVVTFTRYYRYYLLGRPFTIRTDHSSLQWLLNFRYPEGQLARWMEELSQYNMKIQHREGKKHLNADALSRIKYDNECPFYRADFKLQDLACGGCHYCQRAHRNWGEFLNDVDDVIPLASVLKSSENKDSQCESKIKVRLVNHDLWLQNYSTNDIKEAQHKDTNLKILIDWLDSGVKPDNELFLMSKAAKALWINKELFTLDEQGMLWKTEDTGKVLVLPGTMQVEAMALCHDIPAAGHQGVVRTLSRIKERFYWYSMTLDIQNYVSSCAVCNRNKKPTRHARCNMTQFHAGVPMERVHLDFLGPLPVTKNHNGYILMMVDQFTKWVECIPLPAQTAEVTARAAINEFFTRFGYPLQIFTDQGTNFTSELFTKMCKMLEIHKTRTTPFRASANGQVERFNRTLMDAVRCYVSKTPREWDEYIPQIAAALRSSVNRSTGYTPNMLMLGRETTQPVDLVFPGQREEQPQDEYLANLTNSITTAHETARDVLKTTQNIMKRDYDLRTLEHPYKVGDAVYVLDTATVKGKCRKLSPSWKGPGVVVEKLSAYLYKVKLRGKIITMNHDRMKICRDRHLPEWIQKHVNKVPVDTNNAQFCICRGPDTGSFMIQCDECRDWFHGSCVKVSKEFAEQLAFYLCPKCEH